MKSEIYLGIITLLLLIAIHIYRVSVLKQQLMKRIDEERSKFSLNENECLILKERNDQLVQQLRRADDISGKLENERNELLKQNSAMLATNNMLQRKLNEQLGEFEQLQKQAALSFENLANSILKKNSREFSEVNQKRMSELIGPLKEKIEGFGKKVEESYEKGLRDQTDLRAELKKLYELNHRISTEASNLTRALKGDVKQQGSWGEVVLERILERSGLTEGQEFEREKVMLNGEGKTIRPDVIVNLPDKKHLIIDSKVSLVAYERWANCDDAEQKALEVKAHLTSLRQHIKGLSDKHYSSAPQLNSPDFVLLFLPVEASFSMALEYDQQLFAYAWDNRVVLVSPSTLLATLRTIASIWQQENQTRNALEIARQSGALYDKFVGFINDLDKLGSQIDTLQKTYDQSTKKLYTGSGNLVRRIEKIRELGASASKDIPEKFRE